MSSLCDDADNCNQANVEISQSGLPESNPEPCRDGANEYAQAIRTLRAKIQFVNREIRAAYSSLLPEAADVQKFYAKKARYEKQIDRINYMRQHNLPLHARNYLLVYEGFLRYKLPGVRRRIPTSAAIWLSYIFFRCSRARSIRVILRDNEQYWLLRMDDFMERTSIHAKTLSRGCKWLEQHGVIKTIAVGNRKGYRLAAELLLRASEHDDAVKTQNQAAIRRLDGTDGPLKVRILRGSRRDNCRLHYHGSMGHAVRLDRHIVETTGSLELSLVYAKIRKKFINKHSGRPMPLSSTWLAKACDCRRHTAIKHIRRLVRLGLIEVARLDYNGQTTIHVTAIAR